MAFPDKPAFLYSIVPNVDVGSIQKAHKVPTATAKSRYLIEVSCFYISQAPAISVLDRSVLTRLGSRQSVRSLQSRA